MPFGLSPRIHGRSTGTLGPELIEPTPQPKNEPRKPPIVAPRQALPSSSRAPAVAPVNPPTTAPWPAWFAVEWEYLGR